MDLDHHSATHKLPVWIFDASIDLLQWLATTFRNEQLENAAELGRIGKYYAVEDMVTEKPEEMYGTITLQEHFNRIATQGQEYDPYTTMFAKAPQKAEKKEEVTV